MKEEGDPLYFTVVVLSLSLSSSHGGLAWLGEREGSSDKRENILVRLSIFLWQKKLLCSCRLLVS